MCIVCHIAAQLSYCRQEDIIGILSSNCDLIQRASSVNLHMIGHKLIA